MSKSVESAPSMNDMSLDELFDPTLRQGKNDMSDYLATRDYMDENGAIHDSATGKFKSNPNKQSDDEYYNSLLEGENASKDTRFEDKSLKDLAEIVSRANADGDRTLAADAREAFDDLFIETAEKQGWEGVVEHSDGTVDDRNAIAEKRLAYYESLMSNGESSGSEDKAEESSRADDSQLDIYWTEERAVGEEDALKRAQDSSDEKSKDEQIDISWTEQRAPGEERALERARVEKDEYSQDESIDISWAEDRAPGEEQALERASSKDYEQHPGNESIDISWAEERAEGEEEALKRAKNETKSSQPESLAGSLKNRYHALRDKLYGSVITGQMKLSDRMSRLAELKKEHSSSREKKIVTGVALGVTALAGAGALYWLSTRGNQIDTSAFAVEPVELGSGGHDTAVGIDVFDNLNSAHVGQSGEASAFIERLSDAARHVHRGEGGWETLQEMGVPASERPAMWEQIGSELSKSSQHSDLVYRMPNGEWGWSKSGEISNSALDKIAKIVKR